MKAGHLVGIFLLVSGIMAGCTASSGHHGQPMPDPESFNAHFGDMDSNSDDFVNWEEFKAFFPRAEPKVYAVLDLNKDGFVDHDEWHEFKEAHGLKHEE